MVTKIVYNFEIVYNYTSVGTASPYYIIMVYYTGWAGRWYIIQIDFIQLLLY